MADFLLEIGLEEVPARMIALAEEELAKGVVRLLERERLVDFSGGNKWIANALFVEGKKVVERYSTPRRLAVLVNDVSLMQEDLEDLVTGPSVSVAYKDGALTPAAYAFAKRVGTRVEEFMTTQTPKGEYVCARVVRKGRSAAELLAAELPKEVLALYLSLIHI